MALAPINRSELPVMTRTSTVPRISIADNGQIRPNKAAVACVNGKPENLKLAQILFDPQTRQVGVALLAKAPKGVDPKELFELSHNKVKGTNEIKPNDPPYFGAASALRNAIGYDYKASGTQAFDCTFDSGLLIFTCPERLTPRPKKEKAPKAAAEPAAEAQPA